MIAALVGSVSTGEPPIVSICANVMLDGEEHRVDIY